MMDRALAALGWPLVCALLIGSGFLAGVIAGGLISQIIWEQYCN